ncbi:hypothetical protein G6F60_015259 [Rhizopus arrhizus]|nr:hypothetical protein G6F60_015259 [Rhizopus arrhizus]
MPRLSAPIRSRQWSVPSASSTPHHGGIRPSSSEWLPARRRMACSANGAWLTACRTTASGRRNSASNPTSGAASTGRPASSTSMKT